MVDQVLATMEEKEAKVQAEEDTKVKAEEDNGLERVPLVGRLALAEEMRTRSTGTVTGAKAMDTGREIAQPLQNT